MAIINIYSKRQRKIRGEVNDVYQYSTCTQGANY